MPLTRRELLKGIGAGAGIAGITGTGYKHLIPFIRQPDDLVPGEPIWYATGCRECPAGCGMIVKNVMGRAVKCEGNPEHPINNGALCARGQAALHGLYDPDRIKGPLRRDTSGKLVPVKWEEALKAVGESLVGKQIALLSDLQSGPLEILMREWLSAMESSLLVIYEPVNHEALKKAALGVLGRAVVPSFYLDACDYLISFGADFLETWISPVEYARRFAEMRRIKDGTRARFVYVGPRVSMTAAVADERIIVPPHLVGSVALSIYSEMGQKVPPEFSPEEIGARAGVNPEAIRRIAREALRAKSPLALPGEDEISARTALLISRPQSALVDPSRPHALTSVASAAEMKDFIRAMAGGEIDVLLVYGANPVYSLPESAGFIEAMKRVPLVISMSSYMDETAAYVHWLLPSNTPLESWGAYTPYEDVWNLMQPAMGTLFDTRQVGDILMALARAAGLVPSAIFGAENYLEYLRLKWRSREGTSSWEDALQRGGQWAGRGGPAARRAGIEMRGMTGGAFAAGLELPANDKMRLHAYPSIYLYDGRGANRWWLQEMSEPVTRCVWGTWAEIHPETAAKLEVDTDDVIEISAGDAKIELPALKWEGVAPNTIAVPMGQGHTEYGRFAAGTGSNVLRLLAEPFPTVEIRKTGRREWTARVKGDYQQHGRGIARTAKMGEEPRREEIDLPLPEGYGYGDFYPGHKHTRHRWAMVVDMDRCIGCNACVAACYAENNIPPVGRDGIRRRREMKWIRIDPYIDWRNEAAPVLFQPMLCQHCDSAPCEAVCPVYAAVHSDQEGYNEQVYNRCIGTRYCANNCPYKVRRFNWFDYKWPPPLNYQLNPDVTVRSRGVMEKCTFCVQRIRRAEIIARREGRPLRDQEVIPACAQTCPTGVFTFGDLMDPNSRVSKIFREDPRGYQVLRELRTKPGVIYLKRIVE